MMIRWLLTLLVPLTLLALACGPAAVSDPSEPPAPVAQTDTEPTGTPPPPTPFPTKPPLPTPTPNPNDSYIRMVGPSITPVPTLDPFAEMFSPHPEGLDGCKSMGMLQDSYDPFSHQGWCKQQLGKLVVNTCEHLPTAAEQWECGEAVVAEYDSISLRRIGYHCDGITHSSSERETCTHQALEDFAKALRNLAEAWEKVRLGAADDPDVAKATEEVVGCLKAQGFEDVGKELLFPWQVMEFPAAEKARDERLTQQEKQLRDDCAKQHGLYETQKTAWAAELERLDKEEPDLVADLIREGLLETLRKPGVPLFLSGEVPQFILDRYSDGS